MANFCSKCGTAIDKDTGLCPNCDAQKLNILKNTPKFCRYCGSAMDMTTGLCPECSKKEPPVAETPEAAEPEVTVTESAEPEIAQEEPVAPETDFTEPQAEVDVSVEAQATVATAVAEEPTEPETQDTVTLNQFAEPAAPVTPVYEQPAPIEYEPAEQEEPPQKKKGKASTVVATVLLSICFFITAVLSLAIFDVRNSVSDDNAEDLLEDVKFSSVINASKSETKNNAEKFYGYLEEALGVSISDSDMNKFVDKSTMTDFASDKIADFFDDFFEDDAEIEITYHEFYNLLEENSDLIYDEFGVYPDDEMLYQVTDWMFEGERMEILDSADMENDSPALYHLLHIGLSYVLMGILLTLCLMFAALMIWNSWSQALCGVGINFIILGSVTGICAILSAWLSPLWSAICGGSAIGTVIGNVFSINGGLSLALFVGGIALLVIRKLILVLISKIKQKKLNNA